MRVGIAQIDIKLKDKSANLAKCEQFMEKAKEKSIDLLVFPECTLTGYIYESFEQSFAEAENIPGDLSGKIISLCEKYQITALFGFLEKDKDLLYNSALLVGPEGIIVKYRKTHLLYLGTDRFTSPGNEILVHDVLSAKIAPLICYDLRFPEPTRVAALKGAQMVITPVNLSKGAEAYSSFINKTRACENRIFVISANRVGVENGFEYLGKSQIIDPYGEILAEASGDKEELIYADISPELADAKGTVVIPGEYEYDIFEDRKPYLYEIISK